MKHLLNIISGTACMEYMHNKHSLKENCNKYYGVYYMTIALKAVIFGAVSLLHMCQSNCVSLIRFPSCPVICLGIYTLKINDECIIC